MGLYPAAAARASHATAPAARRGYPSDLSDGEWSLIEPLLPAPRWGGPAGGRPEAHPRREIVNAIRYLVRSGCAWRQLPADLPPWQTVYDHFHRWQADGTTSRIHDALHARARLAAGRDPEPTAAVIDSQSVRAADTVPKASRGWDNAKKVNGRKRHIAVDTLGLLLAVVITPACVQDRDAARPLLWNLRRGRHRVRLAWADAGYQAGRLTAWAAALRVTVQIVRKPDDLHTFQVLPRRWVVERTFAWISKYRRTVRDYERLPAHHEAMIQWAMIAIMARRLARPAQPRPG
jgi:transposase